MASGLLFGINAALNLGLMLALARILNPAAYGALAIWSAAALFVATASFDWLRFGAMRFYTGVSRRDEPAFRGTLDTTFVSCMPGAAALIGLFAAGGLLPGLTGIGAVGLMGFAIGNAANEYFAALSRNLSDTRTYARLVALRHGFTLAGALGVAAATQDPQDAMLALGLAVWPSVIYGSLALRDRHASARLWTLARVRAFAVYGLPLIAAEALFQAIGLVNRLWLTSHADLAAAGIYSLTIDLAFKIVAVMASVTEATLLPRLISREAELAGRAGSGGEVRAGLRQLVLVMLGVTLATAGIFWLAAPLAATILLSPGFRSGFLAALGPALIGACLYVVQTYVLRPIFQIGLRTTPLLQSALLALAVDGAMLHVIGAHDPVGVITAQVAGLAAGAALLVARGVSAFRPELPPALPAH